MFGFFKKTKSKINVTEIIDRIEARVYTLLKPYGFRKYGRTLHRFVDGDVSQVINFQCGQAYRDETHLMWVNTGIRVPECMLRSFNGDTLPKKYYHEYECNIRSHLGTVKKKKESCYDLRGDTEKITKDIVEQIGKYVLPVFDVLNSRSAILKERKSYPHFDVISGHLRLLDEAMIFGRLGDIPTATARFNEYYKGCLAAKDPVVPHIKYLEKLAEDLGIALHD